MFSMPTPALAANTFPWIRRRRLVPTILVGHDAKDAFALRTLVDAEADAGPKEPRRARLQVREEM